MTDLLLENVIQTLAKIADLHDMDTRDHAHRSKTGATMLGIRANITGEELKWLSMGACIHDIGKISIDRYVLRQASNLTKAQRILVQQHTVLGHEMIYPAGLPQIIQDCVLYHHEHWDGSGYPKGLTGDSIPLCARIVCIADVWDAITSNRPHRTAMAFPKALSFMNDHVHWFDPTLFATFLSILREIQ